MSQHETDGSEPYHVLRFGPGEIPDKLLTDHSLKAGVRGRVTVVSGSVTYVVADGRRTVLTAGESLWIPPEERHHLEDADDAAIEVAFHRVR